MCLASGALATKAGSHSAVRGQPEEVQGDTDARWSRLWTSESLRRAGSMGCLLFLVNRRRGVICLVLSRSLTTRDEPRGPNPFPAGTPAHESWNETNLWMKELGSCFRRG